MKPADRMLPLEKLQLDPANARRHTKRNLELITASLKRWGQQSPVIVNAECVVLKGNGTVAAARQLGWTEIWVERSDLTGPEARAYAIADNRSSDFFEWDEPLLHQQLKALELEQAKAAGYAEKELNQLMNRVAALATQDVVPAMPAKPVTKPGDLWKLGDHRLVCGDALLDPGSIDLALDGRQPFMMVTDPPYGVKYAGSRRPKQGRHTQTGKRLQTSQAAVTSDDRADWSDAFRGDVAYVWHGSLKAHLVHPGLVRTGYEIRSVIIWRKPQPLMGRSQYWWQHEPCYYAVRQGAKARWAGKLGGGSTIWDIMSLGGWGRAHDPKRNARTGHATQKPVECMARAIRNHGAPGDLVYDPFAGSGSTLIAGEELGRIVCCVELEAGWCDVIVQRWEKFTGKKATRVKA